MHRKLQWRLVRFRTHAGSANSGFSSSFTATDTAAERRRLLQVRGGLRRLWHRWNRVVPWVGLELCGMWRIV